MTRLIFAEELTQIVAVLMAEGYTVIGPKDKKLALNLEKLSSPDELALGFVSEEKEGYYRLKPAKTLAIDAAKPMNSPKYYTEKANQLLYTASQVNNQWEFKTAVVEPEPIAFFGLNACDVASLYILDLTFKQEFKDPVYEKNRQAVQFVVGVNCTHPGNNCFCSTYNTGPRLTYPYDLGLTCLGETYLVEAGSQKGKEVLAKLKSEPASQAHLQQKETLLEKAKKQMSKAFNLKKACQVLADNYEHPYWDEPSERCLSCANCINVCPTCYCYQIYRRANLSADEVAVFRSLDACHHLEFAAVHGGNFRPRRVDRLRHWVNHKIFWTIEQYGVPGCVGCGRCITWCPTAIDITEPVFRLGGREVKIAA